MLIEMLLACILGITVGVITGLLPGIHINLVASLVLAFALTHHELSLSLAIFITSLSFTHIMIDFIPTTLLGVPTEDDFLVVMPAHRLVKRGQGYKAIHIAMLGVLFSIPLVLLATPFYILVLPHIYKIIEIAIPYVLIAASLYLIFRERDVLTGLIVFLMAGWLGFLNFNLPIREPLLPMLTGLFGISSLFISMQQKESIPKQKIEAHAPKKKHFLRPLLPAFIIAPLCSFLPGIGSGHISLFCSEVVKQNHKQFIFLNGLVASMNMAFSIIAAYAIARTRSGSAVAIDSLLKPISLNELGIILFFFIFTVIIIYGVGKYLAVKIISAYNLIPHQIITIVTIFFVLIINIIVTNSLGLVILAAGTCLGIVAQQIGVRKIQLMGALLLPTILYYFL